MSAPRPVRGVVVGLLFTAFAGCWASHGRDAVGGRDAAPLPRDAGSPPEPDARGPAAGCEVSMVFEIFRGEGEIRYPALARVAPRQAMLVFTRVVGGDSSVWALPITSNGNPQAPELRIGAGQGGTLVGATLGDAEPGFTLSYQDGDGQLGAARMGPTGEDLGVASLPFVTTSRTPLLVLTAELAANGWDEPGTPVGRGFVQELETSASTDLTFAGTGMHGVPGASPDRFRVGSHDGTRGYVEHIDAGGAVGDVEVIELSERGFPVATEGIRVVEGEPSAVVLFGGTIRALWDGIILARLRGASHEWFLADDLLHHVDAAHDPETDWLGAAAGVDRGGAPHVLFHGLNGAGETVQLVVAGPLSAGAGPPHPAILETGPAQPTFLIVWEENERDGVLRGGHVRCE